ncbi:unnamed protein product [Danaus chrysippus]|uniref:(African queen) hypothetical protein n=1 Tax=Danaus chrysippus TaxID=151541 RepID=A0A8J2QFS8_9NEOP|nr:unnamed protein product [Danaus chrysippus]
MSRCYTPEPQASTHDTRTKNCLPYTRTFTPQVSNLESDKPDSTRALVDALKLLQRIRFADENNSEDESPDRALSSGIGPSMPSFNENSKLGAVSVAGPSGSIPQPGVSLSIPLLDEDVEADGAGSSDDQ